SYALFCTKLTNEMIVHNELPAGRAASPAQNRRKQEIYGRKREGIRRAGMGKWILPLSFFAKNC
ncbi:MAG: hypothetical protein ACI4LA_00760, partial [Emergencia sp.]